MPARHTSRRVTAVLAAAALALAMLASAALAATIEAKALDDHGCDGSEWHFVITGIRNVDPPEFITVTWADGSSENVPLTTVPGNGKGNVAHYTTTTNLDVPVESATADIASGWKGQFNLSHGPCGLVYDPDDPEEPVVSEDPDPIANPVFAAAAVCDEEAHVVTLTVDNRASNVAVQFEAVIDGVPGELQTAVAGIVETRTWDRDPGESLHLVVKYDGATVLDENFEGCGEDDEGPIFF